MDHAENQQKSKAAFETAGLYGATETSDGNANYLVTNLHGMVEPTYWLRLGTTLPFAVASLPAETVSGLSDMSIEVQLSPWSSEISRMIVWTGMQLEFPTGSEEQHLGAGHYGILPTAALFFHLGKSMLYLQTGARLALGESTEHHDEHGSIIDPHSDQELVYRGGIFYPLGKLVKAELAMNGQTVLASEDQGETFLTLIPRLNCKIYGPWVAQMHTEIPISASKRMDFRVGLGLSWLI